MEHKAVNFIIQGMQRDLNVARYDQNFAYENMNVRITAIDDKTLLAVTNEKGNKKIIAKDTSKKDENGNLLDLNIIGNYVGHCIVGKYLVLFTTEEVDYIYKFIFNNNILEGTCLYKGNLGFSEDFPIESLGVYESEDIQKVYWVDGKNPIRYINIEKYDKYQSEDNNTIFDFTGEVPFPKNFVVNKLTNSSGEFASGIIQYTYSFYDDHGRESNLIDVSPLYYITNTDRGADAETHCANIFEISIEGINNSNFKYDYIRIYSIHRTSLDAIPTTKVVTDIKLDINAITQDIKYLDLGNTGYVIDPYELLYKGGETLIPKTLVQKDNTLFLGNFVSKSNKVDDNIKDLFKSVKIKFKSKSFEALASGENYYNFKFQLNNNSNVISTFKQGETYRFGVQLQDSKGKWSEAIYIGDYTVPYTISSEDNNVKVPMPYITLPENLLTLINDSYKNIRGLVVYPNELDKTIVAQGILCPTVFNLGDRCKGNIVAQSSWFIRPFAPEEVSDHHDSVTDSSYDNSVGASLEFRHEYLVPVDNKEYNMEIGVSPSSTSNRAPKNPWGKDAYDNRFESSLYYVDQSILTFHSPEVTFNNVDNSIENYDLKMKIVGFVPLTSFISDIQISTESTGIYNDEIKDYIKIGVKNKSKYGYRSLSSGLFYYDSNYSKDEETYGRYAYLVFPWHRNGSLNNTPKLSSDKTRTAVLKRKVMSNLKFSHNTEYLDSPWEAYDKNDSSKTGITPVKLFNSNELSVVKIPKPKYSEDEDIIYMGNIDSIATGYNIIYTANSITDSLQSSLVEFDSDSLSSRDPVSIKYKSTPHLVFGLNNTIEGNKRILPNLNGLNVTRRSGYPVWNVDTNNYIFTSDNEAPVEGKYYTDIYNIQGIFPDYDTITKLEEPTDVLIYDPTTKKFSRCKGFTDTEVLWTEVEFKNETYFKYTSSNGETVQYYKWVPNWGYNLNTLHSEESITVNSPYGGLYLAELYKDVNDEYRFGGNTELDIQNNLWVPAGRPVSISNLFSLNEVRYEEGDTYYQRFDCLKTYPYTNEDQNSIVEIVSFMCETHVNIDGRYDRNRGQNNNINMSPTNFNLFNSVYNQRNNFFNYRILPQEYDNTEFPTTITWTLNKNLGEKIDSWTKINLASVLDLDGNNGPIQKLQILNDEIYSFQNKAIAKILFNSRVQIPTSEGVPIEISNSGKVDGKIYLTQEIGTINKWSIITTPNGTYFIDNNNFGIYLLGNGIKCISDTLNMSSIIKEYSSTKTWNPKDADNFRCFYDRINSDVYFVNKVICLCYNELLGQFTSFYNYENTPMMINIDNKFLSYKNNYLWEFFKGDYNSFYDEIKPFYITWVANPEPMKDKIFNNIEFRSDTYYYDTLLNRTFDTLEVWNEYQNGKSKLTSIIGKPSNLKRKFRIWRAQIPRHSNTLQRIRNPWCYIKLSSENPSNYKTIFYDATLSYSV